MPAVDAVFFDLDGTLLDTAPDFAVVLQRLCAEYQVDCPTMAEIKHTVSHGARALVTLAFAITESDPGFEALRQRLLQIYAGMVGDHSVIYPGMDAVLEYLQAESIAWGIVTNKPLAYAAPLLQRVGLALPAEVLVCPDHVTHSKPHPEPLLRAAAQLQRDVTQCIYVGDHRRDIEAGAAARMRTIAAHYGYVNPADPAQDWGADFNIDKPQDIIGILQEIAHV